MFVWYGSILHYDKRQYEFAEYHEKKQWQRNTTDTPEIIFVTRINSNPIMDE